MKGPPNAPLVALEGVSKVYGAPGHETVAVSVVSLEARAGEMLLLLGPSGSGKTTLLTLMAGLLEPTAGRVTLLGHDVASSPPGTLQRLRAGSVGFVFQTFRLWDSLTALENVLLVLRFAGTTGTAARRRARALLDRLGVGHLGDRRPRALSQGEKQRVAVARALANDPLLLVADEPTASLDTERGLAVVRLLAEEVAEGRRGVVVTSHDGRIRRFATRTLELADGRVGCRGPSTCVQAPQSRRLRTS